MKKSLTLGLLLFLASSVVFPREVVDNARFRATYQFSFKTSPEQTEFAGTDLMILDIGTRMSKFYSRNYLRRDSILTTGVARGVPEHEILDQIRQYRRAVNTILYSFWEENIFHNTRHFVTAYHFYREPRARPNWRISGETKEIGGYTAVRASAYYLGRNWTVYFAPEIPINLGPWKLWGLPGLILEAADEDGFFSFRFRAFEVVTNNIPIVHITATGSGARHREVNKEAFRRMHRMVYADPMTLVRSMVTVAGQLTPEQEANNQRFVAAGGTPFIPLEPW